MDQAFLTSMRALYEEAAAKIAEQLTLGNLTQYAARRKAALLAQIEQQLKALGDETASRYSKAIPKAYIEGAESARSAAGFGVRTTAANFIAIDTAAVETALATAVRDSAFALDQVFRRAQLLVDSKYLNLARNKAIGKLTAAANATGASAGELSRELAGYINPDWFQKYGEVQEGKYFKLSGRTWKLSDYAHLTAQVHLGTSQNLGGINTMRTHGFQFAKMSRHSGSCKVCAKYEGKVYSLTGAPAKDHRGRMCPPIETVPGSGGLVHPYCGHSFSPWGYPDPELAAEFGNAKTAAAATRNQRRLVESNTTDPSTGRPLGKTAKVYQQAVAAGATA